MKNKIAKPIYEGKIRSLYPAKDDTFIMFTSDRVSAFDVIFKETIAQKGTILNQISCLWFKALEKHKLTKKYNFKLHLLEDDYHKFPEPYCNYPELANRSIHITKTTRINFECIVRAYLAGSAHQEYKKNSTVSGITLAQGISLGEKLPTPLFTPSTKAELGNKDINITYEVMENELGAKLANSLREISLGIYNFAAKKMEQCGIILADTKFEFGLVPKNNNISQTSDFDIVLIDEVLTPDSSRYWDKNAYLNALNSNNISAHSLGKLGFDKQYIRDYLNELEWNKKSPPPSLPTKIIDKTTERYLEIQKKIQSVLL